MDRYPERAEGFAKSGRTANMDSLLTDSLVTTLTEEESNSFAGTQNDFRG